MSSSLKMNLETGDRAPVCMGVTADGAVYASEAQAGRSVVLIMTRSLESAPFKFLLSAFSAEAGQFVDCETDLVALIDEDVKKVLEFSLDEFGHVTLVGALNNFLEQNGVHTKVPEFLTHSPKGFFDQIGFEGDAPEVLVVDSNQRVARRIRSGAPAAMVAAALDAVKKLPREEPRDICAPAPILILPNLLDAELCTELIELHKSGYISESPSLVMDEYGKPRHKIDHRLKKRRDFLLERDHPMSVRLTDILMRRCVPEIKRAFQAEVSHMDRYNIACYPGDGGHFRRHRDNRPELVSFRRFALSINLTPPSEAYEGGYLRLPEFNGHRYRCPTGGGIMFSVNLLHEITPVLSGNRYVLVTHLHDDEGEAKWQVMRQTLAGAA